MRRIQVFISENESIALSIIISIITLILLRDTTLSNMNYNSIFKGKDLVLY